MKTDRADAHALVECTLDSPRSANGAVSVFRLRSDSPSAIERVLDAPIPQVGALSLRRIADTDDALLIRVREDTLLVTPHGGIANTRAVHHALTSRGATEPTRINPSDVFPEAADLHEARTLAALATNPSPRAVDLLLDQPRRWRAAPDTSDTVPAALDHLLTPPRIIVIGRENIGKSSLLNALARETVALAADHKGTTRDHIGLTVLLDGLKAHWIDTPGIPSTHSAIPDHTAALVRSADLVIAAHDAAAPDPIETQSVTCPVLRVALRADKAASAPSADAVTSVASNQGLAELASLVRTTLVPDAAITDPRPWRFWDQQEDAP